MSNCIRTYRSMYVISLNTYLSKVEVQNFDEIFRETDQYSIHAPICGEVGRDNGPHRTRRNNWFPWNLAFLRQTINRQKDLINYGSLSRIGVFCLLESYISLSDARQPLLQEQNKTSASLMFPGCLRERAYKFSLYLCSRKFCYTFFYIVFFFRSDCGMLRWRPMDRELPYKEPQKTNCT